MLDEVDEKAPICGQKFDGRRPNQCSGPKPCRCPALFRFWTSAIRLRPPAQLRTPHHQKVQPRRRQLHLHAQRTSSTTPVDLENTLVAPELKQTYAK